MKKSGNICDDPRITILTTGGDSNTHSGRTFFDKTADIKSCTYIEETEKYEIIFKGEVPKPYSYRQEHVAICKTAGEYDPEKYAVLLNGQSLAFSDASLLEPVGGNFPCFVSVKSCNSKSGDVSKRIYEQNKVAIVQKASANDLFQYLHDVERNISENDGCEESYLLRLMNRLSGKILEGTVACALTDPEHYSAGAEKASDAPVIYPFGCNLSQMKAVDNALNSQTSLIEGPPGTGKTQTILNIIANLLIRKQTIMVASPNNSATRNVLEKLQQEGLGFLSAELGNKKNKEKFIEKQPPYPVEMKDWLLDDMECQQLQTMLIQALPELRDALEMHRQIAIDREELRQWELEQHYFLQSFEYIEPLQCRAGARALHLKELREYLCLLADSEKDISLIRVIVGRFVHGIGTLDDYRVTPVELELRVARTLFEMEIARLKSAIDTAEKKLSSVDADQLLENVSVWSRKILQAYLAAEFYDRVESGNREQFDISSIGSEGFRKEYRVVSSTVNAAFDQLGKEGVLYDYVIIDESSQCNLTTGLLTLASARHAVVVGDTKQLPCVISSRNQSIAEELFKSAKLPKRYSYASQSLLSSLKACAEVAPKKSIPVQLLQEHYRCNPAVIRFCNQRFYGGQLVVMRDEKGRSAEEALLLVEAEGHDSFSDFNRIQAGIASEHVIGPLLDQGTPRSEIGVITPFRKQADGMQEMESFRDIEIDTVHKFQGREKDTVVFVTEIAKPTEFVNNPNLVNVSVSRAKERLILMAAPGLLVGDGNIAELARYIRYQGGHCIQVEEPSMFDLLYSTDEGETPSAVEKDTLSEVLVEKELHELLSRGGIDQVSFVRNYPLKMFVPSTAGLDIRELDFVNSRAHADFLFYRIVDKRPLLVLEVDGQQHDTPVQRTRDELKDAILEKASIPCWRLRTNEYRPEKLLEEIVEKVCELAGSGTVICVNTAESSEL